MDNVTPLPGCDSTQKTPAQVPVRDITVNWQGFPSTQVRSLVEGHLSWVISRLPWWCGQVDVIFQGVDGDDVGEADSGTSVAGVSCSPEYRAVKLVLYGGYFGLSELEQRRTLFHELAEMYISPMRKYMEDIILNEKCLDVPDVVKASLRELWRQRCEGVCEDLAVVLGG